MRDDGKHPEQDTDDVEERRIGWEYLLVQLILGLMEHLGPGLAIKRFCIGLRTILGDV